ncbi:hypothetical protein EC988_000629, partial [Linderina pennispora]
MSTAKDIADWATNELGFRKKATLVTMRGTEKLSESNIQPLLQGDLSSILAFLARHTVSKHTAQHARHRLASYHNDSPYAYSDLRKQLDERTCAYMQSQQELDELALQNQKAVQAIESLAEEVKMAQLRIRERRTRVLVRQAMVVHLRRLVSCAEQLVRETACGQIGAEAGLRARAEGARRAMRALAEHGADRAEALEQRRAMVASVISFLKELQDRHVRLWSEINEMKAKVSNEAVELERTLERISRHLNAQAAPNSAPRDFRNAILRAVEADALAQVSGRAAGFVPEISPADASDSGMWAKTDSYEKVQDIASQMERLGSMLRAIRDSTADLVNGQVVPQSEALLKALRYVDLREAWNGVELAQLQSQNEASWKISRASTYPDGDPTRQALADIARAVGSGVSGQANDVVVTRLADQLIRDLHRSHVMDTIADDMEELRERLERLGKGDIASQPSGAQSLEAAVEAVAQSARQQRESASAAFAEWAAHSNIERSLGLAHESQSTELAIAELSDA